MILDNCRLILRNLLNICKLTLQLDIGKKMITGILLVLLNNANLMILKENNINQVIILLKIAFQRVKILYGQALSKTMFIMIVIIIRLCPGEMIKVLVAFRMKSWKKSRSLQKDRNPEKQVLVWFRNSKLRRKR